MLALISTVQLIEIELQSWFKTLRFANRKACDVDAGYYSGAALSGSLTNQ